MELVFSKNAVLFDVFNSNLVYEFDVSFRAASCFLVSKTKPKPKNAFLLIAFIIMF